MVSGCESRRQLSADFLQCASVGKLIALYTVEAGHAIMAAQLFLLPLVRARHVDRHDAAPAVLLVGEDIEQVLVRLVPIDGFGPGKDSGQLRIGGIRYGGSLGLVDTAPGMVHDKI